MSDVADHFAQGGLTALLYQNLIFFARFQHRIHNTLFQILIEFFQLTLFFRQCLFGNLSIRYVASNTKQRNDLSQIITKSNGMSVKPDMPSIKAHRLELQIPGLTLKNFFSEFYKGITVLIRYSREYTLFLDLLERFCSYNLQPSRVHHQEPSLGIQHLHAFRFGVDDRFQKSFTVRYTLISGGDLLGHGIKRFA